MNRYKQKIRITTDENIKVIAVDSSLLRKRNAWYVVRSGKPLLVRLQADSSKKTIVLHPTNSAAYWLNLGTTAGIGMLVERKRPKRYGYPRLNYLTLEDTVVKRYYVAPQRKGTINLGLSVAFTTIFDVQSPAGKYRTGGIGGLEAGLEYFYRDNRYVSLYAGAGTTVPIGEYFGPGYREVPHTFFASLRNNHVAGSFDLGYGVNIASLGWKKVTLGDTINLDQTVRNNGIGLSLSAQYRLQKYFKLGLLYQPNLVSFGGAGTGKYQHYISLNAMWKIPLRKVH